MRGLGGSARTIKKPGHLEANFQIKNTESRKGKVADEASLQIGPKAENEKRREPSSEQAEKKKKKELKSALL